MARRDAPAKRQVPPTLTPHRAMELIRRQLQQFDAVIRLRRDDPEVDKWSDTTGQILQASFGQPQGVDHEMVDKFKNAYGPMFFSTATPDSYFEERYRDSMATKRAILESCIDQLEILAPPIAQVAPGHINFTRKSNV